MRCLRSAWCFFLHLTGEERRLVDGGIGPAKDIPEDLAGPQTYQLEGPHDLCEVHPIELAWLAALRDVPDNVFNLCPPRWIAQEEPGELVFLSPQRHNRASY